MIGCWRFTATPTENGVVTVGSNETTPPRADSILGEFMKANESQISETTALPAYVSIKHNFAFTNKIHIETFNEFKIKISLQNLRVNNFYTAIWQHFSQSDSPHIISTHR